MHLIAWYLPSLMFCALSTSLKVPSPFLATSRYFLISGERQDDDTNGRSHDKCEFEVCLWLLEASLPRAEQAIRQYNSTEQNSTANFEAFFSAAAKSSRTRESMDSVDLGELEYALTALTQVLAGML
jgi:hypothetical protein